MWKVALVSPHRHVSLLPMKVGFALLLFLSATFARAESAAGDESTFLTNIRQLTFEGKRSGEGYFSADGKKMIFQSEREADNPFYQIYLMDLETGDQRR